MVICVDDYFNDYNLNRSFIKIYVKYLKYKYKKNNKIKSSIIDNLDDLYNNFNDDINLKIKKNGILSIFEIYKDDIYLSELYAQKINMIHSIKLFIKNVLCNKLKNIVIDMKLLQIHPELCDKINSIVEELNIIEWKIDINEEFLYSSFGLKSYSYSNLDLILTLIRIINEALVDFNLGSQNLIIANQLVNLEFKDNKIIKLFFEYCIEDYIIIEKMFNK